MRQIEIRTLGSQTLLILTILLTIALGVQTIAAQSWNVAGSGDWFTASNWSPSAVPTGGDTAVINNGGHAMAGPSAPGPLEVLLLDVGKNGGTGSLTLDQVNVALQGSLDIGDVEGTFATGSGTDVSSVGNATITDTSTAEFGLGGLGDINAGQTSAASGATAMGIGEITIERITNVQVVGDLDLGQTSGTGQATGEGTGSFNDITGSLSIGGDLDVGQTSADVGGNNVGMGTLTVQRVTTLEVGGDLDVGQTTGAGQSVGIGIVNLDNVGNFAIGVGLDIGKVRALGTANNQGSGQVTIQDTEVSIGFGTASPGSIEIARVLVSETAVGIGNGSLLLDQSDVIVANDVIVGALELGSSQTNNSATANLTLVDSRIDTRDLSVATRLDATSGTISGSLELTRSLAIVQSVLSLSQDATLRMVIDGTTRALGDGLATDYSAIDADTAVLGGTLEVTSDNNYAGPTSRGAVDEFQLITTLLGASGAFASTTYDGLQIGSEPSYVGAANGGDDGLFVSVEQMATEVVLTNYLALSGDANGDRVVDGLDFIIWNSSKFTSGTNWASGDFNGDGLTDGLDFILWNANKFTSVPRPVPEASSMFLFWGMLGLVFTCRRPRRAVLWI